MTIHELDSTITTSTTVSAELICIQTTSVSISISTSGSGEIIRMYSDVGTSMSISSGVIADPIRLRYTSSKGSISSVIATDVKKYLTISANVFVNSSMEAYRSERDILPSLKAYLPSIKESKVFQVMLKSQSIEVTRFFAYLDKLLDDYFIDTATAEGISFWEKDFGIDSSGKSLEQRKQLVKARLHKPEILTKQRLEQILTENFYECSVEKRTSDLHVVITIRKRGVPKDVNAMTTMVDTLLPAHLTHEFIYTFIPWDEIEQASLTWDQADKYSWSGLESAYLL